MQMPEMDGHALARTLRERGSQLGIVALLRTCSSWLGAPGGTR